MTGRVVQKFGGTLLRERTDREAWSRRSATRRTRGHEVRAREHDDEVVGDDMTGVCEKLVTRGHEVVVVVSAIGRDGDLYATDTLTALARQFAAHPEPRALDLLPTAGDSDLTAVALGARRTPTPARA